MDLKKSKFGTEILLIHILSPFLLFLSFIVIILLIPLYLFKKLHNYITISIHPDWIPMSGHDATVSIETKKNRSQNVLLIYNVVEGDLSLEEARSEWVKRITEKIIDGRLIYEKFQKYYEPYYGYYYWKNENNFRIEDHFKLLNGVETEADLANISSELVAQDFEPQKSPWEIFICPNYKSSDCSGPQTLVLYRFHHGLGDGFSFCKLLVQHLSSDTLSKVNSPKTPHLPHSKILQLFSTIYTFYKIPYILLKQCIFDIDENIWFKSQSDLQRDNFVSFSPKINVELFKQVAKNHKVSFSSVVYSTIGGGIRRFFKKRELGEVPDIIRTFAPFPWKKHPDSILVNHWSCVSLPILTGIKSSIHRMEATNSALEELKNSPAPIGNYICLILCSLFPNKLVEILWKNWWNTGILSNFPGPLEQISYYRKYPMSDLFFWAPHLNGNSGIGISVLSYMGFLRFGLNVDRGIFRDEEDVKDLCYFIQVELEELLNQTKNSNNEIIKSEVIETKAEKVQVRKRAPDEFSTLMKLRSVS